MQSDLDAKTCLSAPLSFYCRCCLPLVWLLGGIFLEPICRLKSTVLLDVTDKHNNKTKPLSVSYVGLDPRHRMGDFRVGRMRESTECILSPVLPPPIPNTKLPVSITSHHSLSQLLGPWGQGKDLCSCQKRPGSM